MNRIYLQEGVALIGLKSSLLILKMLISTVYLPVGIMDVFCLDYSYNRIAFVGYLVMKFAS